MKVIEFQDGTFLAVDSNDTPLFEFTFHATLDDLKSITNTELHSLVDAIFAKFIIRQRKLKENPIETTPQPKTR